MRRVELRLKLKAASHIWLGMNRFPALLNYRTVFFGKRSQQLPGARFVLGTCSKCSVGQRLGRLRTTFMAIAHHNSGPTEYFIAR
jgi:hypothetical protein